MAVRVFNDKKEPRIASVLDVNGEGENAIYSTSDMRIVATLLSRKVEIDDLSVEESGRVVFHFRRSDVADDIVTSWLMNKPIPIDDVRIVFEAISNFHAIVRHTRQTSGYGGEKTRTSDSNTI